MNSRLRTGIIVAVVLVLLLGGWYGWRAYANHRTYESLQAKAVEMVSQPRDANGQNNDLWREGFREIRDQVETLPEAYQQQFRQSMGNYFMSREEKRMDEYLALSKPERKKHLDKLITEDEKRRKEWDARRKTRDAERAQQQVASTARNGSTNAQPGEQRNEAPRGDGRGRGSLSARLDSTSPAFRAKRSEFRRDMEQRRKELGLPADGRGGRR